MVKSEKIKYLLIPAAGFGIGGALLALSDVITSVKVIGIKFAIIVLAINFFISLFFREIEFFKKVFIIFSGILVWIITLCLGSLWVFLFGFPDYIPKPDLYFGSLLIFLLAGLIVCIFYFYVFKFALKSKIWPVFWRGTIGISLACIVNLVNGELFGYSFVAKIVLFILTGIIVGLFLGWGIYKGQKLKEKEVFQGKKMDKT